MSPRLAQLVAALLAVAFAASMWHKVPVCAGQNCVVATVASTTVPTDAGSAPTDSCCPKHVSDRAAESRDFSDSVALRTHDVPNSPAAPANPPGEPPHDDCTCGLGCCSSPRLCLLSRLAMPSLVQFSEPPATRSTLVMAAPLSAFHFHLLRPPRA